MAPSCTPPKKPVRGYTRAKPRRKPKSSARFVVRDDTTGKVRSRHRTLTGATRAENAANRGLRRIGQRARYEMGRL